MGNAEKKNDSSHIDEGERSIKDEVQDANQT